MKRFFFLTILVLVLASTLIGAQQQTATFRFTQRFAADTQQAADRKLAAHLAPYVESRGRIDLCEKEVDGTCKKNAKGEIIYDLAVVSAQLGAIFEQDIATAAKERLRANRLTAASVQADADFEAQEKPTKP